MILAACEGRGNGEKDAEGLAGTESGEGSDQWEVGRVDKKEGEWGGVDGNGEGETGRGNLEGSNGEGEMGRGATGTGRGWQWGRGGEMGRWQQGGGKGERGGDGDGEKKGQEEGRFHRWI